MSNVYKRLVTYEFGTISLHNKINAGHVGCKWQVVLPLEIFAINDVTSMEMTKTRVLNHLNSFMRYIDFSESTH
jgi:hypothetical protein